jgi:Protein of unknown function (DUF4231)
VTTEPEEIPIGLSPYEMAVHFRDQIKRSLEYMQIRKKRFRFFSSGIKVLSLVISASATIILGLQDLSLWAGLGFSLVALVTVINAIEPFFNWRSRWVLAEEAQYRFHRVKDDLEYLVATRSRENLQMEDFDELYKRYEDNWRNFSEEWLNNRRQGS